MTATSMRLRRRAAWFERGAHAIGCVVSPRPPAGYVCPLCLGLFTREQLDAGELTDEHVPPKAVGGNPLVLTCVSCNGASGGLFDESMADEEKLRTFGTPQSAGPLPGSVSFRGIRNNGSIDFDGERWKMLGDPGQNNPETLAAHTESLKHLDAGSSLELRLSLKANPRRARIGWARSAYLAAFAVYGYRYVLQPALDPLRAALEDPDNSAFDPVIFRTTGESELDPLIGEVTAPQFLAGCRAAVFGPRVVLLPPWGASQDWFATLRKQVPDEREEVITLVPVIGQRFPEGPIHLTDG
ncbi:MAG: hypothetical protein GY798_17215 [Hyphomicrobiales bacterium]|nr:hypothetical protein [Hyphomicrobiales bacterium]